MKEAAKGGRGGVEMCPYEGAAELALRAYMGVEDLTTS